MSKKKLAALSGLMLASALVLTGCGDKDTPAMSPSPTGSAMMDDDDMMTPSPTASDDMMDDG